MTPGIGHPEGKGIALPVAPFAPGTIRLSDPAVAEQVRFIGLTTEDLGVLAAWKPVCRRAVDGLIEAFYDHIDRFPATRAILLKHTTVERQRPLLTRYVLTMLDGVIDDAYLEYRRRVGVVHDDIDLGAAWYVGMYEIIRERLTEAVAEAGASGTALLGFSRALSRLIQVDIALVVTALMTARRRKIESIREDQARTFAHLLESVGALTEAALDGRLDQRVDESAFEGRAREVVAGLNATLGVLHRPIMDCVTALESLAEGDLTARMNGHYRGEFGRIKARFDDSAAAFNHFMSQVSVTVERVNSANEQVVDLARQVLESGLPVPLRESVDAGEARERVAAFMKLSREIQHLNWIMRRFRYARAGEDDSAAFPGRE